MSQIPELLEMIAILRQKGISGESVAFDWMTVGSSLSKLELLLVSSIKGEVIPRDVRKKRSQMEKLFVEYNDYSTKWSMFLNFLTLFQC